MAQPSPQLYLPDDAPTATPVGARSFARQLFASVRPGQWTKNFVVFAALLFGRQLFDVSAVVASLWAFAIFCALSGAVYLVNDVLDREADRRHPLKALRPIASGAVSPGSAITAAIVMSAAGLAGAWFLGRAFFVTSGAYLVLLTLYSGPFKKLVILDVLTIALGFVLRAVAGACAIHVPISHWLLVCTILLALFLALAKRRQELVMLAEGATGHRRSLQDYSAHLLDQMIAIVAAATIMSYALYTVSQETVAKFGTDRLLLTLPFPIYGIFRYLYLVYERQGGGSPAELLLHDRPLLLCVLLWAAAVVLVLYTPLALPLE